MNRRQFLAFAAATGVCMTTKAEEKPYRVGVIGHTGRGNYGHGVDVMWDQVPGTTVTAVADADASGLANAKKRLRDVPGFADYRKMLAEAKPDIVAVAPRFIDEHHEMILASIDAGVSGIYVEKPFCRTPAEADQIVAACQKHGVKLAIAHRNRYHPVLGNVATLIKDGLIGRVLELRGRGKEDSRGGALDLWVLGAHVMNLIHHFGGTTTSCTASVLQDHRPITKADVKEGAEGTGPIAGNEVHARFETERGVPAFFDSVQNAGLKNAGFGLQIIGTTGVIDFRCDTEPFAQVLAGSPFQPSGEPRVWTPISTAGVGKPETIDQLGKLVMSHALGGRDLVASMRDDRSPLCSANDGRTIVEMISAVFESHRNNGARVPFPLTTRQAPLSLI